MMRKGDQRPYDDENLYGRGYKEGWEGRHDLDGETSEQWKGIFPVMVKSLPLFGKMSGPEETKSNGASKCWAEATDRIETGRISTGPKESRGLRKGTAVGKNQPAILREARHTGPNLHGRKGAWNDSLREIGHRGPT